MLEQDLSVFLRYARVAHLVDVTLMSPAEPARLSSGRRRQYASGRSRLLGYYELERYLCKTLSGFPKRIHSYPETKL